MGIILTILCFGVAAILYILLGGILKQYCVKLIINI